MASTRKPTREVNMTPQMVQAAGQDPVGALSYMLISAFGISLSTIMNVVQRMLSAADIQIPIMCLAAAVQIRGNVVFVGREFAQIMVLYPELVIPGNREVKDVFNFGALHAAGHVIAHIMTHDLGQKILAKAGSCIDGTNLTDNEAGNINKEIYASWTPLDKGAWPAWLTTAKAQHEVFCNGLATTAQTRAAAFAPRVQAAPAGGRRAPVPPAGAAPGAPGPAAPPA